MEFTLNAIEKAILLVRPYPDGNMNRIGRGWKDKYLDYCEIETFIEASRVRTADRIAVANLEHTRLQAAADVVSAAALPIAILSEAAANAAMFDEPNEFPAVIAPPVPSVDDLLAILEVRLVTSVAVLEFDWLAYK